MSEVEYYVVQDGGFDSGRIYGGPYDSVTTAYKKKSRLDRKHSNPSGYKVVEE